MNALGGKMLWDDLAKQLGTVWWEVVAIGGELQHGDISKADTMFTIVLNQHEGRCFLGETPMDAWKTAKEWLMSPEREVFLDLAEIGQCCSNLHKRPSRMFDVGDTLRMPHYETAGGFRVWKVEGIHLGGENQEGTYHLKPVDMKENSEIHVPCIILETHPEVEMV